MARRPKQKMLTSVSLKECGLDFMDRLNGNYSATHIIRERRAALEEHLGGRQSLSYVQQALIKRVLWLEILVEHYEQKVASGGEVDIGAITQLNNTLKGHYKDLGFASRSKVANPEDEIGKLSTRKPVTVDGTAQKREAEAAA